MDDDTMRTALDGATDTERVVIAPGALSQVAEVFTDVFGTRSSALIVCDANTWEAAGEQVQSVLGPAGVTLAHPYVWPAEPRPYASHDNVEPLVAELADHSAIPIAVGSGTINDLVKRAAFETDRGYMCVGTAASVDGYTSFGASLTVDGSKQTLECPAPKAVVMDLDVLRAAPDDLTASGYGDLLGKVPAGADWIIADALGVDPIPPAVWERVQGPLHDAIGRPAELQAGDEHAMEQLVDGLVMSGLAMQAASSSRPASGAEHYFSHLWEMEDLASQHPSHGIKVGLGSICVAAFYERLLERDLTQIDVDAVVAAWPSRDEVEAQVRDAHDQLVDRALDQTMAKYVDADTIRERAETVRDTWPQLSEQLREQLLPAAELERMLAEAGCPTTPSQVGLSADDFRATYWRSRMIRTRYTVMDLAYELGLLTDLTDELFADGGFWADPSRQ